MDRGMAAEKEKLAKALGSTRKMTPEVLQEICKERSMWSQPHLNTRLYLNYKGFDDIAGLENYVGVKTLHLGNNNIAKIESLDRMSDLRCLFLEGNRLTCIENLHNNLELRQLNLEGNAIRKVANLSSHIKLEQINLAHNQIESLEDISELQSLTNLTNVDVSYNSIEATEGVVEFWSQLAGSVRLLRYHNNPGVRSIEHYRKRLVNSLPILGYLDERPVFPVERKSSKAWSEGGKEAMEEAKREHFRERNKSVQVDPERRELLTRMRKLAIARIDREAKEREEQEEERLKSAGLTPDPLTAVSSGDAEALADYAQKWRGKVNLYGPDGLRDKVSKEDSGAGGPFTRFAPPSRVAVGPSSTPHREEHQHRAPEPSAAARPASASAALSARRGQQAQPGASDFRTVTSSLAAGSEDHTTAFQERQFSVIGDEHLDLGLGEAAAASSGSGGRFSALQPSGRTSEMHGARREEPAAMPLIWQQNQQQASVDEMRCMDQNFANSRAHSEGNDLAALD